MPWSLIAGNWSVPMVLGPLSWYVIAPEILARWAFRFISQVKLKPKFASPW